VPVLKGPRASVEVYLSWWSNKELPRPEERVERDEEDKIISKRQREGTNVWQTSYTYQLAVSWKSYPKRNSAIRGFVLQVKCAENFGHDLLDDPLAFPEHMKELEEYQTLIRIARLHNEAIIPYLESHQACCFESWLEIQASFAAGSDKSCIALGALQDTPSSWQFASDPAATSVIALSSPVGFSKHFMISSSRRA